jgi:uncharacterized protein (TIGR02246 family)
MLKFVMLAVPIALLSVCVDAYGQEKAANNDAAVKSAIERATTTFTTAINAGKYADAAAIYAEDAIVLPPESDVIKGRAAIQEFFGGWAAYKPTDFKLATVDVEIHDDIAIERGTYSMKITPPGATAPLEDNGKFMVVWKRQSDGSWQVYRDMYNTNIAQH